TAHELGHDGDEVVAVGAQSMEPEDAPVRVRSGFALDAVQQHGRPRCGGAPLCVRAPAAHAVRRRAPAPAAAPALPAWRRSRACAATARLCATPPARRWESTAAAPAPPVTA